MLAELSEGTGSGVGLGKDFILHQKLPSAANGVEAEEAGDAVEPDAELAISPEGGELFIGGEEGVLSEFPGFLGVTHNAKADGVDPVLLGGKEGVQGFRHGGIGGEGPSHDLLATGDEGQLCIADDIVDAPLPIDPPRGSGANRRKGGEGGNGVVGAALQGLHHFIVLGLGHPGCLPP